jgi:hypothetical protein
VHAAPTPTFSRITKMATKATKAQTKRIATHDVMDVATNGDNSDDPARREQHDD